RRRSSARSAGSRPSAGPMIADADIVLTLGTVVRALEDLGVTWAVGGSVASTVYGEPRATNDVDIVANLEESLMPALKDKLGSDFYADLVTMKDAADRK